MIVMLMIMMMIMMISPQSVQDWNSLKLKILLTYPIVNDGRQAEIIKYLCAVPPNSYWSIFFQTLIIETIHLKQFRKNQNYQANSNRCFKELPVHTKPTWLKRPKLLIFSSDKIYFYLYQKSKQLVNQPPDPLQYTLSVSNQSRQAFVFTIHFAFPGRGGGAGAKGVFSIIIDGYHYVSLLTPKPYPVPQKRGVTLALPLHPPAPQPTCPKFLSRWKFITLNIFTCVICLLSWFPLISVILSGYRTYKINSLQVHCTSVSPQQNAWLLDLYTWLPMQSDKALFWRPIQIQNININYLYILKYVNKTRPV